MKHSARIIDIENLEDIKYEMLKIGVDKTGISIMTPKALERIIKLKGISTIAANIIKQEMLARGGEVALSSHAINYSASNTDLLIFGTIGQIESLLKKLRDHQFGLPEVASEIEDLLKNYSRTPAPIEFPNLKLNFGERTYIMGVLNVTPDSFSDGGKFFDHEAAVSHAKRMIEDGADIIDIGGESTRPGAEEVSSSLEINRVLPVIKRLRDETAVPISIDTTKASVAEAAFKAGAQLLNDISGLRFDKKLAKVAAEYRVPTVIMHIQGRPRSMQENPHYEDLITEMTDYLKEGIEIGISAGIKEENIIIDPGIGFGKTLEHNLEILRRLKEFKSLGRPILIGTSRKSMIGKILNLPVEERLEGTAATVAISIMNGADIVRVHDVASVIRVAKMTDAIVRRRDSFSR